jgi:Ca-activated chloride channel homolog
VSGRRRDLAALGALVALLAGAWEPLQSRNRTVEEGNARLQAGQAKEALDLYDRAAARMPDDPALHFDRGAALYALGRLDEAGQEFLRATEARDGALKAAAFYNLGNTFLKKKQVKEALAAYRRSLVLDPRDARAKWNLELALRMQQEEEKKKEQDKQKQADQQGDKDKDKNQGDKDQDQKDQDRKDQQKQAAGEPPPGPDGGAQPEQPRPQEKQAGEPPKPPKDQAATRPPPAGDQEIEAVLDSLDKPKSLERERARLRALQRRPPAKDW